MSLDKFFPLWVNIISAPIAAGFAAACYETGTTPLVTYPVTGLAFGIMILGFARILHHIINNGIL